MKKVLSVLMISLLSACASQTTQPIADVEDRSINADDRVEDGNVIDSSEITFSPLHDPNSILSNRSVYYDFNSYTVSYEYKELVLAHAKYLRDQGGASLLLQGNTDERGSREYNLALGQRRADSVKNMMILSGARDEQIEAVSLGEEKPHAIGHDESSWNINRRTDIIYQGE